jgi:threonine/homoserine/homoserine lactone efflux protein
MDLHIFVILLMTQLLLSITPGPAVLCILSNALSRGALRSTWASLGVVAANGLYFLLSATGVSAMLIASYRLFAAIRWIGVAYLVWMGLSVIFGKASPLAVKETDAPERGNGRIFLNGLAVQMSNPKALLFFTALLPQFLDPHKPLLGQMLIIMAVNVICDLLALCGYGAVAGSFTRLGQQPRFRRVADVMAGSMLISAGVATARIRQG